MAEPEVLPSERSAIVALTWADGAPALRLRTGHLLPSSVISLQGLRLRYRALEARICLGHRPSGGSYLDCRAEPAAGKRRCDRCQAREATFAAQLHHAHTRERRYLDQDMAEHLSRVNVLYLAAFRDGSLKVGTSTASRTKVRLAEQGAWLATVVAEADDGFVVREIEDHVTEFLGITQAVAVTRKLEGMVSPVDDDQLRRLLAGNAARVHTLIRGLDDPRLRPSSTAWSHPASRSPVWQRPFRYPLDLATGEHEIEVLDACGRMIAIARPSRGEDVFVADVGRLLGVALDPAADGAAPEIAVQDSLF